MFICHYINIVSLYKKKQPCLPLQRIPKMYCAKFQVIPLKNSEDMAKLNDDLLKKTEIGETRIQSRLTFL